MSFQILDKEEKAIGINELDKEAAAFWSKEVDPKFYASPTPHGANWFDVIGYQIHSPSSSWTSGWRNVKCSVLNIHTEDLVLQEDPHKKLDSALLYIKPYLELIDHWESKGYIPKQVKE